MQGCRYYFVYMLLRVYNIVFIPVLVLSCINCSDTKKSKRQTVIKEVSVIRSELGLKKGLRYYQDLKKQFIQSKDWKSVALCENKIGECQEKLGFFDKALQKIKANLIFIQKKIPKKDSIMISTRYLLAQMYMRRKLLDESVTEYKWLINNYAFVNQIKISLYNDIGGVYQLMGKSFLSEEYHLKALGLLRESKLKNDTKQLLLKTYGLLGSSYGKNNQSQKAIEYYKLALETVKNDQEKSQLLFAMLHNNIGLNYLKQDRLDSAKFFFQVSVDLLTKDQKNTFQHLISGIYNNTGELYLKQKNYKTSQRLFQKALKIRQQKFGNQSNQVADCYYYLGLNYQAQQLHNQALDYFQKSLIANHKKFEKNDILENPTIQGGLDRNSLLQTLQAKSKSLKSNYKDLNRLKVALKSTLTCDTIITNTLNESFKKQDKIRWSQKSAANSSQAVDIAYQLAQLNPQKRRYYLDQAFYFAEQNKASVLSASLAEVDARKFAGIPDDLLEKEKKLRIDINFFKSRLLRNPGDKQQHYKSKLFDLNRAYETLIESLENNYKDYYALKYERKIVSLSDLQQKLAPGRALLQYITGVDQSYVFVITRNKVHLQPLASADKLFNVVKKYYYNLQGGLKLNEFAQASYQAYQELFQPIEKYLQGIQKLIIIPDWQLAKLPFEALIKKMPNNQTNNYGDLNYLVTRFEINYHYSASIWYKKRTKSSSTKFAFVAFAPFSDSQGNITDKERFANELLPASGIEVKTIDSMFKKKGKSTDVYFANRATKEIFQKRSPSAKIIHIASHSKFGRKDENRTQISFARNDSLLVGSIYNLELNADLVVLSSCESGMGKSYKGEGMMSLSRSFLYAGARNIVFSYWRVKDNYTKDLMIDFYKGFINQNYTYARALQAAKKAFIEKNKNLHPKFWSGFAIVGD